MASMHTSRIHALALAGMFLAAAPFLAGVPARAAAPDVPASGKFPPWAPPGYNDYRETARPAQPAPAVITAPAVKYTISVTSVPQKAAEGDADRVVLMLHLPEDAKVWIEGDPTTSTGKERTYKSPPVTTDKDLHYAVRVAWAEDGHWVSKEANIPVKAGQMQCVFIRKAETPADQAAEAAANLAKLSPEDRKLAEAQKFCVVENKTLLGAVGVPVKVMVKDQPVFLCCKACEKEAQADPEKTLAKVKELIAKNAKASEK